MRAYVFTAILFCILPFYSPRDWSLRRNTISALTVSHQFETEGALNFVRADPERGV